MSQAVLRGSEANLKIGAKSYETTQVAYLHLPDWLKKLSEKLSYFVVSYRQNIHSWHKKALVQLWDISSLSLPASRIRLNYYP